MVRGAVTERRLAGSLCAVALVASTAVIALVLAALAGERLRDWREAVAVSLGVSAVVAWCTSDSSQVLAPVLATVCIMTNATVAAWHRADTVRNALVHALASRPAPMLALPAPRALAEPPAAHWSRCQDVVSSPLLRDAAIALSVARTGCESPEGRPARVA